MKRSIRACPICKKNNVRFLHRQKFVLPAKHVLPQQCDLVCCSNCGFVFADTPVKQDTYDRYYAGMSKYDQDYNDETNLYVDTALLINMLLRDKGAHILEVGCGNGKLLQELRKRGFSNLTGMDPSKSCVEFIRSKGIKGIAGSIFGRLQVRKKFDCIITEGVLEHIYELDRVVDKIKSLLAPGGLFFAAVPDASRYQDYDQIPFDYFNIEHINHFDEISLINLGLAHGLSVQIVFKAELKFPQTEQPIIFCAYKNDLKKPSEWRCRTSSAVLDYITATKKKYPYALISRLSKSKKKIIVWGAGNFTSRLLKNTELGRCNIIMFVDNDVHKQGTAINGITVSAPDAILKMPGECLILVAAAVFHYQILDQIKKMGLNNKVLVLK